MQSAAAHRAPARPPARRVDDTPTDREAWMAEQVASLTPEEREEYCAGGFFKEFVDHALTAEWDERIPVAPVQTTAEWRAGFLARFEVHFAADELARAESERAAYADEAAEMAAIEAGTHPLQKLAKELQAVLLAT